MNVQDIEVETRFFDIRLQVLDAMEEQGETDASIAEMTGNDRNTIRKIRNGQNLTVKNLLKICLALGLEIEIKQK